MSQNDWQADISKNIENLIFNINEDVKNILNKLPEFKNAILNSKYNDIIDFNIYNNWIKKQIKLILELIKNLLEKNIKSLLLVFEDINNKKEEKVYSDKKGNLELAQKRVETNLIYLEKNLDDIDSLIKNLAS